MAHFNESKIMNHETGHDALVTGTIHSIYVSKRGIEVNVIPEAGPPEGSPYFSCRLDRSLSYSDAMLKLATAAMLNGLTVSLLGFGDDRDDTLEFDEIRVVGKSG